MIAALLLTVSLAAPATLTHDNGRPQPMKAHVEKATKHKAVVVADSRVDADPNSPDHDPSFVEQYLSFQLSPAATPAAKDGLVMSHVIGYLLYGVCGTLWGPIVAVDGAEFSGDVVLTWFLSGLLWAVISTAASFTGIGLLVWLALPYLQTTATLNAIDRQLKRSGAPPPDKTAKPTNPPSTTNPPPTTDTPPPSYAY